MIGEPASGRQSLDDIVERTKLPGTALVRVGDRAWNRGDVDAHFVIYSVTKSVIAAAFLQLAGEGVVDLAAPVSEVLDDHRFDATIAQVLTHVGGIPDYGGLPGYHAAVYETPSQPWTDEVVLDNVLAAMPVVEPGKGWAYSNTGYLLLRRILDAHGGLAALLPALGFSAASVALELSGFDQAVPAVSTTIGEGVHDVRGRYHPAWVGHRTLVTTARDLDRFWSASAVRLLDAAALVPVARDAYRFGALSWGLGVGVLSESPLGPVVGHGGGGPGYSAGVFVAPRRDAVAIVLEPTEDSPAQETALGLLKAAAGSDREDR